MKLLVANGELTQTNESYNLSPEYKHKAFAVLKKKAVEFESLKDKAAPKHKTPATKKKAWPEKKSRGQEDCTQEEDHEEEDNRKKEDS